MDEFSKADYVWHVKRLSANDTLANHAHQAGPYIPKELLFRIFPSLNSPEKRNPDIRIRLVIDSHSDVRDARVVWYNNKLFGNTRNEARMTNLGGAGSALLDPESTGALAVFCFYVDGNGESTTPDVHVWVCRDEIEEDYIEDLIDPVEPGKGRTWTNNPLLRQKVPCAAKSCWLQPTEIPPEWLAHFPSGKEIVQRTVSMRPGEHLNPDERLMRRRNCEFEIFQSLEEAVELPFIRPGFSTVEDFLQRAKTILQRRKSRSGRSLELHTRAIFVEEGLVESRDFSYQPESEKGKKPDFLFPSEQEYKDGVFPASHLRMLAIKTTCKDRWRQILNEADRISTKHLLTLQEGVSENQFREMTAANVQLVVPKSVIPAYPLSVQPSLVTLESFIGDIRLLKL